VTPREKMTALANRQSLPALAGALALLTGNLSPEERLTRAVIIDAICAKSPAADKACEEWSESLTDTRSMDEVIFEVLS